MKKNYFLSIFLFLLFVSCKQESKVIMNDQPAVVMGIVHGESDYVNITILDILHEKRSFTQKVNPDRTFEFILHPFIAKDVYFEYQNISSRIFITPSDTLCVIASVDSINNSLNLGFSGKDSLINTELQLYHGSVGKLDFNAQCADKPVKVYLSELKDYIEKEKEELKHFNETFSPSPQFLEWANNDIVYNVANYLMDYKMYLVMNGLERNDSLFLSDLFPVNYEPALSSSLYGLHLWHYATDQYIQTNSYILECLNEEDYFNAYKAAIDEVLKKEPEGIIRDIIVFKFLKSISNESFDDFEKLREIFKSVINNQIMAVELNKLSKVSKIEKSVSYNDEMNDIDEDMLSILLEESKKHLIYVDIWATWCGPCRAEIPEIKAMHEKLKDEKIEFISICCNSNKNDWLAIIEDNKLPGKHFLLNKAESDIFTDKITNFQGFPTYLIMKDGVIIDSNAERPSSGEKIIIKLKNAL